MLGKFKAELCACTAAAFFKNIFYFHAHFMGAFVIEGTDFTAHSAIFRHYIVKISALYRTYIYGKSVKSSAGNLIYCGGGNLNGMYSLFRLKARMRRTTVNHSVKAEYYRSLVCSSTDFSAEIKDISLF